MAHIGWLGSIPIIGQTQESIEAIISLCRGELPQVTEGGEQTTSAGEASLQSTGSGQITKEDAGEIVSKLVITGKSDDAKQRVVDELLKQSPKPATDEEIAQVLATNEAVIDARAPARGDHIFNNNVLKVFKNIIDSFLDDHEKYAATIMPKVKGKLVYTAYYTPMNQTDTEAIGKTLVAHGMPPHVDVNSKLYGEHVEKLNKAVVAYMNAFEAGHTSVMNQHERLIKEQVDIMKKRDLYTDQAALEFYLKKKPGDKMLVENMKKKVEALFQRLVYEGGNDEVIQWVNQLKPHLK